MQEVQTDLFSENPLVAETPIKSTEVLNSVEVKEIGMDTQLSYLKIHALRTIHQFTLSEIATQLHITIQTAHKACKWVRNNWEVLNTEEYLKDAERLIGARIREYDAMLEEAKIGELVVTLTKIEEATVTTAAVFAYVPVVENGKFVRKVNKNYVRTLMSDRREYEKMLLEIRGLFQKSQIILDKRTQTINNVTLNTEDIVKVATCMEESDKQNLLQLCQKYGKSPN